MFYGEYKHTADEKGRLRVPAKLKANLENKYVITKGTDDCLFVFNKSYFENEFLLKLSGVSTFSKKGQKPVRTFLSSSYEVEEDGQGRFMLPPFLKQHLGNVKNVTFIGVGNRIEIWDEDKWNKYSAVDNFDDEMSELADLNI